MLRVNIKKRLGDFILDKEWEGDKGEVVVLFGPSGSGKSITVKSIAGLITPDEGYIEINGKYVFHKKDNIFLPPRDRGIGYVPQNFGLFPHMRVYENIIFGMMAKNREIKEKRATEFLRRVGLENKRDRYPKELSGGEKQRVAILRALSNNPKVLLLDEPFSAVDISTRKILRREIKDFLMEWNIPVVLVTHDPEDVKALANKVVYYG